MYLTPEEKITLETYNKTAKKWFGEHKTAGFWKAEMDIFNKLLPSGNILEIGSGGGRDAKELIQLGYDYVGTDISTGLLEIAKKENPTLTFLQQSVYDLNFAEKFDGFWASAVLLHIPKPRVDEALGKIHNVVRKDGIGFISLKQGIGERIDDGRFFAYYAKEEFENILIKNKFETLEFRLNPMSDKTTFLCYFVKII